MNGNAGAPGTSLGSSPCTHPRQHQHHLTGRRPTSCSAPLACLGAAKSGKAHPARRTTLNARGKSLACGDPSRWGGANRTVPTRFSSLLTGLICRAAGISHACTGSVPCVLPRRPLSVVAFEKVLACDERWKGGGGG